MALKGDNEPFRDLNLFVISFVVRFVFCFKINLSFDGYFSLTLKFFQQKIVKQAQCLNEIDPFSTMLGMSAMSINQLYFKFKYIFFLFISVI